MLICKVRVAMSFVASDVRLRTEDPSKCNPRFWEELFLMKVNLEYLEGKLEALDGEELMKIKDNINCLFQHCIQALGEEHPIRVVNALQVTDNISQNTILEYVMINSIFEAILQGMGLVIAQALSEYNSTYLSPNSLDAPVE
ncbi:hypothetical protein llap_16115 [Limosa lapponica baueri]|uniref:Uncharacterized protein n=1 Tax=Limosa lapponica baueri TaxID=1758121 RepID=A0A2I0TIF2_LIMLA|nr:hypothetical protein llap_16115 [Limosa lapponica baueri]